MKSSRWRDCLEPRKAENRMSINTVKPYSKHSGRCSALENRKCISNLLSTAFNWYEYWIYRVRGVSIFAGERRNWKEHAARRACNCIQTAFQTAFKQWTLKIGKLYGRDSVDSFFSCWRCNKSFTSVVHGTIKIKYVDL